MKRVIVLLLGWCSVAATAGSADPPVAVPKPLTPDTSWVFVLDAGSRLYPDWKEHHEVGLGEAFQLGDTQLTAKVAEFMSDFRIIDGKPMNLSYAMQNPAVHIYVYADSGAVDSTWAFLNFPPHYSPKSFFTFQLLEVRGYEAGPDTALASGAKEEGR